MPMRSFAVLMAIVAGASGWCVAAGAVPIDRYVTVQPIQVCDNAGANCAAMPLNETIADKVFGQAGLDVIVLPTVRYNNSTFTTTSVDDFNPTRIDEWRALLRGPGHGQSSNSTTINAFFVGRVVDSASADIRGVSFINGNGIVISGSQAVADTFTHELGHNFGLDHLTFGNSPQDPKNSMSDGGIRIKPLSAADVTPDGQQLDRLQQQQIDKVRSPLFSVGLANATATGSGAAPAGEFERFLIRMSGGPPNESLNRVKVWYPAGTNVASARENDDALIANGCKAPCVTSTKTILGDGTEQWAYDFRPDAFISQPNLGFAFIPLAFGASGAYSPTPFSFTFEFDSGASSQAGFDVDTRSASSQDPNALRSFIGTPDYGPPASELPTPDGYAAHLASEDGVQVPLPATLTQFAVSLMMLARFRRRG